jgi:hypothetical protein
LGTAMSESYAYGPGASLWQSTKPACDALLTWPN